jgi:hypothetical protein
VLTARCKDRLANAVLSLVRATHPELQADDPLPDWIRREIASLGAALRRLADTPQPWPAPLVEEVEAGARRAVANAPALPINRVPTLRAIVVTTARDLAGVVDRRHEEAAAAARDLRRNGLR